MDTSEPDIRFDDHGVCQYCSAFLLRLRGETYHDHPVRNLESLVARIKQAGRGRDYDCIIGVSGGVDSTYVAYQVSKLRLRPLAVHLDNGWDSELAVDNIHRSLSKLGIELQTHVIDWPEFRDLQWAFFLASVTNVEIPTDHAINAILQDTAVRHGVRYIVTGGNIRGEGISPKSWGWYNLDLRHLKAIHRRFGSVPLTTFPQISLRRFAFNTIVRGIRTTPILNYLDYDRLKAVETLRSELGWRPYPGKHYESVFTRFYQGYILPRKFRVDKRRAHLSSMVVAGDMTREAALNELDRDPYDNCDLEADMNFILKKFEITQSVLEDYLRAPPRSHRDFPSSAWFFEGIPAIRRAAKRFAMRT